MLRHSVSYYLPTFWATTPLYAEKIIPLLDTYLSVASPAADKLALAYYDIWNKYTKTEDMTDESIRAFIHDTGFGYLLDLIDDSSESLRLMLFYLPVMAALKDSKQGIELLFLLLKADLGDFAVHEWWESDVVDDEDTFTVDCLIDIANIGDNFLEAFGIFLQKYVHPTLTCMRLDYKIIGEYTLLPVVTAFHVVNLKSSESLDD